jgi:DtxR family Mn-dependent transcriptional regulator
VVGVGLAALLAGVLAVRSWLRPSESAHAARVVRSQIDLTSDRPLFGSDRNHPGRTALALSPDGTLLVWTARTGVDPLEWHKRAERQEHALSREETDALERRLGNPRFDPHGDPIPTADGTVAGEESVSLAVLEPDGRAVVTHLEDEPPVVFSQLVASGVYLGMELRVAARSEQRIVLEADGRTIVLAPLLAENVSIHRLERGGDEPDVSVTLASLRPGESGTVTRVSPACRGIERRRLMDLGIVPGTHVAFERRGLTGGLSAYRVRGTVIALREEQAQMIAVARGARDAETAGTTEGGWLG